MAPLALLLALALGPAALLGDLPPPPEDPCSEELEYSFNLRGTRNATGHPVVESDLVQPASRDPWRMNVEVKTIVCPRTQPRTQLKVTLSDGLNGDILIEQSDCSVDNASFVSTACPTQHTVCLSEPDYQFIVSHATSVFTYWFVNCNYYGFTTDFSFTFNYTQEGSYYVEALVVAHFDEAENASSTPGEFGVRKVPEDSSTARTNSIKDISSTAVNPGENREETISDVENGIHRIANISSYGCLNSTFVSPFPNKTYGYFRRQLSVRAPITTVNMEGSNWIESSEIVSIETTCDGSPLFNFCLQIKPGAYNTTGNETCARAFVTHECKFLITHFFREVAEYTLVFIVSNEISHFVKKFEVTLYEVKKEQQLSVVLVPVGFTMLAILLVIFGVAYYIQSKERFIIEIADFNFGNESEVDVKTFWQRLRDDFSNFFDQPSDLTFRAGVFLRRSDHENFA